MLAEAIGGSGMTGWDREAAIAMERRHIADGERRIERQQAFIARLVQRGAIDLLPMSTGLLAEFRDLLEMSKARRQTLQSRAE